MTPSTPRFTRSPAKLHTSSFPIPSLVRSSLAWGLLALALLVLAPAEALGQADSQNILVSPEWLAERQNDPGLILLHVGREEEYAAEHISGARYVDLDVFAAPEDPEGMTGLSLQMPDPSELARVLGELGVENDSQVVVYFGNDWVTPAARVLFTLDWIGLGAGSFFLDGGLPAWKARGMEVASGPPPSPERRTFSPKVQAELVVTADWVHEHLGAEGIRVIDARGPVHFNGIQATNLHRQPVRKGHIPGATNVPFNELVTEDLHMKSRDEVMRIFRDAGVAPGDTVVGYCHLGQWATLMLLGARVLGHPVRLYDGSFQEWGSREEFPVENPGGVG